jgi:hypothetical protein
MPHRDCSTYFDITGGRDYRNIVPHFQAVVHAGIIGLSSFIDIGASGIARIVSNRFYRDASRQQKLDFEPRSPLNSVHIPAKANTRHHHWAARG